ncbi:MAG: CopD family protein [Longimicrobiales bacterium]|nr:CopD family protein [Longimicrobiales bacterium]
MTWFLTTVQQGLLFSATIFMVGCVAWRIVVAPGAAATLALDARSLAPLARSVVRWSRLSAVVVALAWAMRGVLQVVAFRDPFAPLWDDVSLLLFQTFWGTVWIGQGVVVVVLLATLWFGVDDTTGQDAPAFRVSPVWWGLVLLVVSLCATLALSGHAMGADSWRMAALTADGLHTLSAGIWIGTLSVILLGARSTPGSDRAPAIFGAQIQRFSPLAMVGVGTLLTMGAALSWTHLTTVSDLWATGYGRILSAKIGLVVLILGLGFRNWRQGVPVSDSAEGVESIRRRGSWEVGFAAAVILLTAILVHSTKP